MTVSSSNVLINQIMHCTDLTGYPSLVENRVLRRLLLELRWGVDIDGKEAIVACKEPLPQRPQWHPPPGKKHECHLPCSCLLIKRKELYKVPTYSTCKHKYFNNKFTTWHVPRHRWGSLDQLLIGHRVPYRRSISGEKDRGRKTGEWIEDDGTEEGEEDEERGHPDAASPWKIPDEPFLATSCHFWPFHLLLVTPQLHLAQGVIYILEAKDEIFTPDVSTVGFTVKKRWIIISLKLIEEKDKGYTCHVKQNLTESTPTNHKDYPWKQRIIYTYIHFHGESGMILFWC